jgi:hypothetical protein
MGFFGKSKEEKENEEIVRNKRKEQISNTYKILLESDTITVVNSLIQDYILIFSLYNNEIDAQKYLVNELQNLFKDFSNDNKKEINYLSKNAKQYYASNSKNLEYKLNLNQILQTPEINVSYDFLNILNNNIDSIIDNQNLAMRYFQEVENKDIYEKSAYTITYLMTIPVLIVSIYSKILNYKKLIIDNKDNSGINDLISIIENVSSEQIESKEVIKNIVNINMQLFKDKQNLSKLDFYIYILLIRKNPLIENYQLLTDESMFEQTNNLLDNLNAIQKNSNTIENIENEKKEYIKNYIPKSFVKIDKYMIHHFDYYICALLLDKELISLDEAINYSVIGFIANDYDNTYLYKKALWDFDRYINKDFSMELQTLNLLQKYENIQNGYEFEEFCFSLYTELGYFTEHTKLSNDQGADLVIEKDGIRSVVQAKFYSTPVGNKAVQEVVASKAYYENAPHSIVITNNTFTPSAVKLAEVNSVKLVTGDDIINYIESLIK